MNRTIVDTPKYRKQFCTFGLLFCISILLDASYKHPLSIGFLIMLWIPFVQLISQSSFMKQFLLSFFFFSLHFQWLWNLLLTQGNAPLLVKVTLFFIFTTLHTLNFLFWIFLYQLLKKKLKQKSLHALALMGILIAYFVTVESYGNSFIGTPLGYPLLNPILPLIHLVPHPHKKPLNLNLEILHPQQPTIPSLYHALEKLQQKRILPTPTLFLTPEHAIDLDCTEQNDVLSNLCTLLQPNDMLCIAGISKQNDRIFQTLFFYTTQGLQKTQSKKILIPFYEYIPHWCKKYRILKNLFLNNNKPFSSYEQNNTPLHINKLQIESRICADFFFQRVDLHPQTNLLLISANDQPLMSYAAELMKRSVLLTRFFTKELSIFYVAWQNSLKIL